MFKGGIAAPAFIPLLNGGNAAILFCFACLYLAMCGRRVCIRTINCDDYGALTLSRASKFVMPGLVPGIHVLAPKKDVDGRDEPGHDD